MTDLLRDFYSGKIYPIIVCSLMLISYTTSCEVYVNVINLVLLSIGLLVSDSIRPFIAVLPAYLFQFSAKTAMPTPEGLEFLLSGDNLKMYIISFSILAVSLVIFFLKNRLIDKDAIKSLPFPIAAIILSVAFLTNGLFSDAMCLGNLIYGLIQIVTFFGIFYIFYLGIKNEDGEELSRYLAYVTALVAILLFLCVSFFYITNYDKIFIGGEIMIHALIFGFGISTTAGQCAAILIPMCFFGVIRSDKPWFYFISATLSLTTTFLSMSRNALYVGLFVYVISFVICCFFGKERRKFAIFTSITLLVLGILVYLFKDEALAMIDMYAFKGLDDNDRFKLWQAAFDAFKEFPIFGRGFYGLYTDTYHLTWGFPTMMHNTVLQLLGSMGIFGLVAYLIYRVKTLVPFFHHPSVTKTMIGLSCLVLLLGSLLDNFIFYIPHMLYHPITLAVAFKIYNDQAEFSKDYYHYITRW